MSKALLIMLLIAFGTQAQAQQNAGELVFDNSSIESGTAGSDNAVYRFPDVNETMDALVKIKGRSSSAVQLVSIDITNTGFNKAFQPQLDRGSVSSATNWWMEFQISFVNKGTSDLAEITEAFVTALDIDGNNSRLREWDAFYGNSTYTIEAATQLTMNAITGIIGQTSLVGKQFLGSLTDYSGIDTSNTSLMTTLRYTNTNSITVRFGGTTTGSASSTRRMYSVWFKNFTYAVPMSTLPVKLTSFTATLNKNNKVDLKWITASEMNVSHFIIEKSTDGINYHDAAMVFAYGNTTSDKNYSYADNLGNMQDGVVYYRLRSEDVDGKTQTSETRIIKLSSKSMTTASIMTYPNPVSSELRITIPADWQSKKVSYEIYTLGGKLVNKLEKTSSSQTESVNMSSLGSGMYIVRAICNGEMAQQKIIKQ